MESDLKKVFIIAKPDVLVDGIRHVLVENGHERSVDCMEPGDYCWKHLGAQSPDVVMLHMKAIERHGPGLMEKLKTGFPELPVLVFGQRLEQEQMLDLIRTGAGGYLCDDMAGEELIEALHEVMAGRLYLERDVINNLAHSAIKIEDMITDTVQERLLTLCDTLSHREMDILRLVLKGFSTKEIAGQVHLSEQSVKLYLSKLFSKLQVKNRGQLILSVFQRVCPVSNMVRMINVMLDKHRIKNGKPPVIPDPLKQPIAKQDARRSTNARSERARLGFGWGELVKQ